MDNAPVTRPPNKLVASVQGAVRFVVSARAEMERVTWPTKPELIKATRMIVIFSVVLGVAIGLMDLVLQVVLVDMLAGLAG